jgi:hypothetical protein
MPLTPSGASPILHECAGSYVRRPPGTAVAVGARQYLPSAAHSVGIVRERVCDGGRRAASCFGNTRSRPYGAGDRPRYLPAIAPE